MNRRRRIKKALRRTLRVSGRVLKALVTLALFPLALPLAVPFLALSAPSSRSRLLRDHSPFVRDPGPCTCG